MKGANIRGSADGPTTASGYSLQLDGRSPDNLVPKIKELAGKAPPAH